MTCLTKLLTVVLHLGPQAGFGPRPLGLWQGAGGIHALTSSPAMVEATWLFRPVDREHKRRASTPDHGSQWECFLHSFLLSWLWPRKPCVAPQSRCLEENIPRLSVWEKEAFAALSWRFLGLLLLQHSLAQPAEPHYQCHYQQRQRANSEKKKRVFYYEG